MNPKNMKFNGKSDNQNNRTATQKAMKGKA